MLGGLPEIDTAYSRVCWAPFMSATSGLEGCEAPWFIDPAVPGTLEKVGVRKSRCVVRFIFQDHFAV